MSQTDYRSMSDEALGRMLGIALREHPQAAEFLWEAREAVAQAQLDDAADIGEPIADDDLLLAAPTPFPADPHDGLAADLWHRSAAA